MLLTGTSRTCERTRRVCSGRRVRCRVHVRHERPHSTAHARHGEHTRPRTHATPLAAAQRTRLRSADASQATPDCDAHHRHCQKTGATFAASRRRCSGVAFQHLATTSCASMLAARPASAAWRVASVTCIAPARRYAGHSATQPRRAPDRLMANLRTVERARRFLLKRSFVPRKRKPAAQGGRFGCRDEALRLSGRLPRAARRSRPGSAVRSTAPGRRSPARRSSLRRRRPR